MGQKNKNYLLSQSEPLRNFLVLLVVACGCFIGSSFFVRHVEKNTVSTQKNDFLLHVRVLSAAIDSADIKALTGDSVDLTRPQYNHLRNQLQRVVRTNPKLRSAYLMGQKDGNIIFLVDSEQADFKDYSPPGEVYAEASFSLRSLFRGGEAFIERPRKDHGEMWVSALVPIWDEQTQKTIAVMRLDVDQAIWDTQIVSDRRFAQAIALLLSIAVLVSVYFIRRKDIILQKMMISEERFRHVADGSGDWIWETDAHGLYTYTSQATEKIIGYRPDEIVGKKYFQDFYSPGDRARFRQEVLDFIRDKKSFFTKTVTWCRRDGHEIIFDIKGFALRDKKGRILSYRGVQRDITELKKKEVALELANRNLATNEKALRETLQEMAKTNRQLQQMQNQLIQTEKMATVGVLASGVAHEIKNPLAIILQGVERIEKILSRSGVDGSAPYTSMIKEAAIRANRVVNALLQFARSSRLELRPLDICPIINAAIQLVENRLKEYNIKVRCNFADQDLFINGDSILLEQVFFDLFMNAIDVMPGGGEIVIAVRLEPTENDQDSGPKIIVEVKDTGCGISPEYMSRVFDPFFTTKEPGKGTGLGLSTAYLILERHNGTIHVESQPGIGTTIIVSIPAMRG